MDWTDIEARLKERAEEVCRHLLPNGHRDGNEWKVGSVAGEPGSSLGVNLAGKAGVWSDFAVGTSGKTFMSLWCAVRGQEFKVCIREAKAFLGIQDDFEQRWHRPAQVQGTEMPEGERPDESAWKAVAETWKKCAPLTEGGPVWNYFTQQRKIDAAVLRLYDVREMISRSQWVMVFPYWPVPAENEPEVRLSEPVPEWLKFELLDRRGGKKREWVTRGAEKSLWGCQLSQAAAGRACRHLLITEGEKDALSWASYGAMAWGVLPVSVPFGAKWKGQDKARPSPNREWLDRCWPWMQRFEQVFVAMDSDDAGRRAAGDLIAEIGPRRCRLVELPEVNP